MICVSLVLVFFHSFLLFGFSKQDFFFLCLCSPGCLGPHSEDDAGWPKTQKLGLMMWVFVCLFVCLFLLLLFFGASGLTFAPYLNEECNYQSC